MVKKNYELTNHLGNVLVTISDHKLLKDPSTLTWTNISQMNITGQVLTSTGSIGWADPGVCFSVQGITGDGYVEHTLNSNPYYSRAVGVGLNYSDGTIFTGGYWVWQAWTGQKLQIRVGGVLVHTVPGSFSGNQVIRIERSGGTIYFKVDGNTVYSTAEYGSGTLYTDVEISRTGHSARNIVISNGGGTGHMADVRSYSDYYPYGMPMVGRSHNLSDYRFGMNGMEMDNEVSGAGNSYTSFFRQYDPRLGRWKSIDPVTHSGMSPYLAFDGNPIAYADPRGDDPISWIVALKNNAEAFVKNIFAGKGVRHQYKSLPKFWEGIKLPKFLKKIKKLDIDLPNIELPELQIKDWKPINVSLMSATLGGLNTMNMYFNWDGQSPGESVAGKNKIQIDFPFDSDDLLNITIKGGGGKFYEGPYANPADVFKNAEWSFKSISGSIYKIWGFGALEATATVGDRIVFKGTVYGPEIGVSTDASVEDGVMAQSVSAMNEITKEDTEMVATQRKDTNFLKRWGSRFKTAIDTIRSRDKKEKENKKAHGYESKY